MGARSRGILGDTYVVLAAAAGVTLALEFLRGVDPVGTSPVWPVLQAAVAGSALLFAWRRQDELRLAPTVAFAVCYQLAWIGLHLAVGVPSDHDSGRVYPAQGHQLLQGSYPRSEYPPGAVLLFAFDYLLGGSHTRASHAFVMVPFEALLVFSIWSLRTRWSAWFALVAAFWPANAFIVEFKFDVVPAVLLVVGAVYALRERWVLAGAALGLGAAVKWTPALTVAALCLWLLTTNRARPAVWLASGATFVFLVVNLPFLVWSPHAVLSAYTGQGSRGITGESLPFLPLKAFGLAHTEEVWAAAAVPGWANAVAIVVQVLAVAATFAAVVVARRERRAAISVALMCPVVFLAFNRVFSPQFLILLIAAWFVAGSLLARTRGDQLLLAFLALSASLANALVYPTLAPHWSVFSGFLFLFALLATGWVLSRAGILRLRSTERAEGSSARGLRSTSASPDTAPSRSSP